MENEFEKIWGKIKQETGLKNLKNLAEIVGISQQAVSEMKAKGKFPPGWAYLVGKQFNLLTEWIMTGEGPKNIEEMTKYRKIEILNEVEEWLAEEMKKNPRRESWFELQMIDSFESFKKWKRKRDETVDSGNNFPSSKVA